LKASEFADVISSVPGSRLVSPQGSTYNGHRDHVSFVEKRWKTEVAHFLEIDFEVPAKAGQ
jgi:hypothetical protein